MASRVCQSAAGAAAAAAAVISDSNARCCQAATGAARSAGVATRRMWIGVGSVCEPTRSQTPDGAERRALSCSPRRFVRAAGARRARVCRTIVALLGGARAPAVSSLLLSRAASPATLGCTFLESARQRRQPAEGDAGASTHTQRQARDAEGAPRRRAGGQRRAAPGPAFLRASPPAGGPA